MDLIVVCHFCDFNHTCFRYNANDYYLEELVEEWCEGVIQDNNLNQSKFSSCNKADLGRPQSLLLETVAAHLQKSTVESLAIDLQGLTQVCLVATRET